MRAAREESTHRHCYEMPLKRAGTVAAAAITEDGRSWMEGNFPRVSRIGLEGKGLEEGFLPASLLQVTSLLQPVRKLVAGSQPVCSLLQEVAACFQVVA